jgi:hypothetical protein
MTEIQQRHGARLPSSASAQRTFSVGFVAESHNRVLTPTEMTFYEILAEHYTKPLPPEAPAPHVGFNWVSIRKFFGEGSVWTSVHPEVVRPSLVGERHPLLGARLLGQGFPGQAYTLESSADLLNWRPLRKTIANSDGAFAFTESEMDAAFFRARWR